MTKYKIDTERIKIIEESDFSSPDTKKEVFGLIESLCKIIIDQNDEIQELKDEINRLKGEKGKPDIKAAKEKTDRTDKDNEKPPIHREGWRKSPKREKIKIDRVEIVYLDKTGLPEDIEFKGYSEKIIQNIIIKTDNVLYRMEKYCF